MPLMQVLLNTDHHIDGGKEMADHLTTVVKDALSRFGEHVTQVEAHLADENGQGKSAPNEFQCTLKANVIGRDPVVVKSHADSAHQAIAGAATKLKRAVATVLEKHDPRQALQRSAAAAQADES
jgi:ribosome-associated translation inhibitor RaiA